MNDEIKEILIKDFNEILVKEFCTDWKEKRLYIELLVNSTPFSNLLDYITNLQQEKDSFEKIANQNYKVAEDYKSRINNAIAYMRIDKNTRNNCDIYDVNGIEILDILEGKEEDE